VLAHTNGWRLVLVGDPRQLQGVGRGGMLAELCANGRVDELVRLHRFTHPWEATASLLLRSGDPRAFDAYQAHGRIIAGALEEHLARMAAAWIDHRDNGRVVALVASRNDHVHTVNLAVQQARLDAGHLDADASTLVAGGEHAHVGDVVMTRRNDRRLVTSAGEPVRNRDIWTVTHIDAHGSITVSHEGDHGAVTLPARYAREHVRLGYAATEHGWESDTVAVGISLASAATTRRGLYVAATRGRDSNEMCVITESPDVAEARDVLEAIVAVDRADIPAVTQRRTLAVQQRPHEVPVPVAPTPRCEIPDWFTAVLQDARRDRDDAETRQAERAVQRQRLENAAKIADRNLRHVASATAPDRDAYARAAAQAADARRDYTAAQRRLEAPGDTAVPPGTPSKLREDSASAPRPPSSRPVSEPRRRSSAIARRTRSSARHTTTSASRTPPTGSTPSGTQSTSTPGDSPPWTPGGSGPPDATSGSRTYRPRSTRSQTPARAAACRRPPSSSASENGPTITKSISAQAQQEHSSWNDPVSNLSCDGSPAETLIHTSEMTHAWRTVRP
jgi:hypothetical protein